MQKPKSTRGRGRPPKNAQNAAQLRPLTLTVPEARSPSAVRLEVSRRLAPATVDSVDLLHRAVIQGIRQAQAGEPVKREPIDAAKSLLSMAGMGPRQSGAAPSDKDLQVMTRAELEAFVAGSAAIEGSALDEVAEMFK